MYNEGAEVEIDVSKMLGAGVTGRQLLTFDGSLTTPPYTTGLKWVVSKEVIHVDYKQIEKYQKTPHVVVPNNRPTQDLLERTVTAYY